MLKGTYFHILSLMAVIIALPGMFFFSLSEALEEKAYKVKGKEIPIEE